MYRSNYTFIFKVSYEDGVEDLLNAWPMDEAYVDYVEGDANSGLINNPTKYPNITAEVLASINEEITPDMILQYAHHIGEYYKSQGMKKPKVRVEAYVTLNVTPSQLLIDPQIGLMQVNDGWKHKNWVTIY